MNNFLTNNQPLNHYGKFVGKMNIKEDASALKSQKKGYTKSKFPLKLIIKKFFRSIKKIFII